MFKRWTDVSRFVFNATIDYIRSCQNFTPSWMDIKKDMPNFLPGWCRDAPFQIKGIAIKEAVEAFWKAKGRPAFRKLKDPEQSCFIPKSAVSSNGIYPRVSGKGLFFHEPLPEYPKDGRLIWRFEKWWLAVPHKQTLHVSENQGRVVAIDPGVRAFTSFYSSYSAGNIGQQAFGRIQRLCHHLDRLVSKIATSRNKQQKRSLSKAAKRLRRKIKYLVDELHHKVARFFISNFDVILLPDFTTKDMASKAKRKIGRKSVRNMLTFAHYRFKQFLKWKAFCSGKLVVDCCEAFTSKTHPQTGRLHNIGSAKEIQLLDGSVADRDIVGARNILLRALVDSPMGYKFVPCS